MLIDVEFRRPVDPAMALVLSLVGTGGSVIPVRLSQGVYLSTHWSVDQLIPVRKRWLEKQWTEVPWEEYGVADNPEQVVSVYDLVNRPERVFVSLVKITKAGEPEEGGWRWHKWGPYIGAQRPTREYIHDEPEITEVYTFHILEPA